MPDPDSSPPSQAAKRSQYYPIRTPAATPSLGEILRDHITHEGAMRFADFMAIALYDPTLGYYARGTRQVGRGGDFFTSVSVGPLFGELLARRFHREWRESGSPTRWRIIECGAHDGTLASDVLAALRQLDANAFKALEYAVPEPLPALQTAQRETLQPFGERVRLVSDAEELASDPLPGVAFGNELLDALPFHLVEWRDGRWQECFVKISTTGEFDWLTREIADPVLKLSLDPLGGDFQEGYRTEVRTCYTRFLAPLVRALQSGLMIWADYGFARMDYYHPTRKSGTIRTFYKHQAAENPLASPGEMDITAHVDFTAVAESATSLGGRVTAFRNQGAWLTENAREWLLSQEGRPQPSLMRQFRTLTHPAHLGGSFHFLELSWKTDANPGDDFLSERLFGRNE